MVCALLVLPSITDGSSSGVTVPWKIRESEVRGFTEMLEHADRGNYATTYRVAKKLGKEYVVLTKWLRLHHSCVSQEEVDNFRAIHPEWPNPVAAHTKTSVTTSISEVKPKCGYLKKSEVFLNYSTLPRDALISVADRLLWTKKIRSAEYIANNLGEEKGLVTAARIGLRRNKKDSDSLAVAYMSSDFGLMYDYITWCIRNKQISEEILHLMSAMPKDRKYHRELWYLYKLYIGDIIYYKLSKFYEVAYALASDYATRIRGTRTLPEVHWLLGWIAFKCLKDYETAHAHFSDFYDTAKMQEHRSKAAYWAARSAEMLNDDDTSLEWFRLAALHKTTFYGQLSLLQLGVDKISLDNQGTRYSIIHYLHCKKNIFAKIGYMLSKVQRNDIADLFVQHAIRNTYSPEVAGMITELTLSSGNTHLALKGAERIESKLVLPESLYPRQHLAVHDHHQEIVLSIIRQESKFDKTARSGANAVGLMQLRPSTAMELARDLQMEYRESDLLDPEYNITLGHHYLKKLLKAYDNSLVLALAGYNAGPGNVNLWIKNLGDPRELKSSAELAVWIESVPFPETRIYIQRVLANLQVYNGMSGKLMTLGQ
ncbi:lytic transglycosylase domain-containing protein [Anaplasma capra]|uniref:lytic transglycosylase domain-containing protein n=1 Tax=Anaplasma capra TaxID=1562740 RepID=UPI0021D61262|nr:lytic transglycosylase domain-containing protein [Anaplasma capra]MCU7611323.1 lytic transglycosylase domain-containing protein [Anaplasma capra]